MVQRKAGLLDRLAQVPAGVPVGRRKTDSPFAEHPGPDPIVERGEIERLFRPERVSDRTKAAGIDQLGMGHQQVNSPLGVIEHLPHAERLGMPGLERLHRRGQRRGIVPQKTERTAHHEPRPRQLQAKVVFGLSLHPGDFVDGVVGGGVQGDHSRPSAPGVAPRDGLAGNQEVRLDRQVFFEAIPHPSAEHSVHLLFGHGLDPQLGAGFGHRTKKLEPFPPQFLAGRSPPLHGRDDRCTGRAEQCGKRRVENHRRLRGLLHIRQPGHVAERDRVLPAHKTSGPAKPQRGSRPRGGRLQKFPPFPVAVAHAQSSSTKPSWFLMAAVTRLDGQKRAVDEFRGAATSRPSVTSLGIAPFVASWP